MPKKTKEPDITETFGGSPVSSKAPENPSTDAEINLANAKITVPQSAVSNAAVAEAPEPAPEPEDNSFAARAARASIGLIRVDGTDFRYVGIAPARDKDAKTESGFPITSMNSTFTPLADVAFDPSIRVKIGDKFFYPQNATGWADVELDGKPLVEAAKKK